MPRNPEEAAEGGRLWHRKALSLDLGGSSRGERSKAAAWMWHLHKLNKASISAAQEQASESDALESKRRSSGDHKDSRFPLYLIEGASPPSSCGVWDCDSKLYDTFELVSFSNCLDRSLLGVPAVEALNWHHIARSPLLHHAPLLRSVSLPRASLSLRTSPSPATPPGSNSEMAASYGPPSLHGSVVDAITPCSSNTQTLVLARKPKSWLAKFVKEVVSSHGQMWCFKPFLVEGEQTTSAERSRRVRRHALDEELGGGMAEERERYHRVYEKEEVEERHKHLHHHHHHYHYHFLQQLDQSAQDADAPT